MQPFPSDITVLKISSSNAILFESSFVSRIQKYRSPISDSGIEREYAFGFVQLRKRNNCYTICKLPGHEAGTQLQLIKELPAKAVGLGVASEDLAARGELDHGVVTGSLIESDLLVAGSVLLLIIILSFCI
jgi:hypothetical protein